MAFAGGGDPTVNPKEGEFASLPKGTYYIIGIEDFFSKDTNGMPSFKVVQNDVKAHCHFAVAGEGVAEGVNLPAWSGTKDEYARLLKALGISTDGLVVANTTEFLLEVQRRFNATDISALCYTSGNGWINKINALLPKTGSYQLIFKGARNVDGTDDVLHFQSQANNFGGTQQVIKFQFEIRCGVYGETEFSGNQIFVTVVDPFDGVEGDNPKWKAAENGGMLIGQKRMMTFLGIYWPDAADYRWESDPEKSVYGINEAENPIVVIVDKAMKSGRLGLAKVETNEKGFTKLDLNDLTPGPGPATTVAPVAAPAVVPAAAPVVNTPAPAVGYTPKEPVHTKLIALINDNAYSDIGGPAFTPTDTDPYKLSPKGADWCKTNIIPLWDKLGLGEKHAFKVLTAEQASRLTAEIEYAFGTSEF